YGLSCLTTLYTVSASAATAAGSPVAESPVLPRQVDLTAKDFRSLLAEPPFVPPPPPEQRRLNYWMMTKRATSLSFMLFSSGFALAVYAFFFFLSDLAHLQIGLFRTFGQNALATYIIHEVVNNAVRYFSPNDSPLGWILTTFALFYGITYLFVRHLDKNGI